MNTNIREIKYNTLTKDFTPIGEWQPFVFTEPTNNPIGFSSLATFTGDNIFYASGDYELGTDLTELITYEVDKKVYYEIQDTGMILAFCCKSNNVINITLINWESGVGIFSHFTSPKFNIYLSTNFLYKQNLPLNYSWIDYLNNFTLTYFDNKKTIDEIELKMNQFRPINIMIINSENQRLEGIHPNVYVDKTTYGMTFYSSWYKLITGNFYKQNELFYITYTKGGVQKKFYFGKVIKHTPIDKPTIKYDTPTNEYAYHVSTIDNGMFILDMLIGSDIANLFDITFTSQSSTIFDNGIKIEAKIEPVPYSPPNLHIKISKNEDLFFETRMNYTNPYQIGEPRIYFISPIKFACFQSTLYLALNQDVMGYTFLDISPNYNNIRASELSDYLKSLTVGPEQWVSLLNKVLFIGTTQVFYMDLKYREYYGFFNYARVRQYAFAGVGNFARLNSFNISQYCTTYWNDENHINIDSADKWISFITFLGSSSLNDGNDSIGGGNISGGGDGNFDDTSDIIDIEQNNQGYVGSGGMNIYYLGNVKNNYSSVQSKINTFIDWINNPDILTTLSFLSYQDRINCISSLKIIPEPFVSSIPSNMYEVACIGVPTGMRATSIHQYSHYNLGNLEIKPYFGNFLDYMSIYKIYLPYSGTYELNASDIINKKINLSCSIDFVTGEIIYVIRVNNSVLYTFSGNCTNAEIPISSYDFGAKTLKLLEIGASAALSTSLIKPITSGGNITENNKIIAETAINTTGNVLNITNDSYSGSIGSVQSSSGVNNVQYPYLIVTRPITNFTENFIQNYGHQVGFKSNAVGSIGSFEGMSVVSSVDLKGLLYATDEELQEIENILKTGFII